MEKSEGQRLEPQPLSILFLETRLRVVPLDNLGAADHRYHGLSLPEKLPVNLGNSYS